MTVSKVNVNTMLTLYLWAGLLLTVCSAAPTKNKLLLMSFDGFPAYYLKNNSLPTFEKFINSGVTVPYVISNFPTKTFPSHVTISTGLFSESHGIVYNSFYDPDINQTFILKNPQIQKDPRWWRNAEPIWMTAEKQGIKAGIYFWPGSETTYEGKYPSFSAPYNSSIPFKTRADKIVKLLSEDSYDFGVLYFNEPDKTGHSYGPTSPQVKKSLKEMDDLLKYILDSLQSANLEAITNIIITSDHGMVDTPATKYLNLTQDLNFDLIERIISSHANFLLDSKPGRSSELYRHLLKLSEKFGHMTVYNKSSIPEDFHWKNNKRVPQFTVLADEGYKIITKIKDKWLNKGDHGYVPSDKMYPMFAAKGPAFKKGKVLAPFKQEDIYVLMSNILNINPKPHNGSFARVKTLLKSTSMNVMPIVQIVLASNCLIISIFNLLI